MFLILPIGIYINSCINIHAAAIVRLLETTVDHSVCFQSIRCFRETTRSEISITFLLVYLEYSLALHEVGLIN